MKKFIPIVSLLLSSLAFSQQDSPFGKIDTVTFGECDDSSPVLAQGLTLGYYFGDVSPMLYIQDTDSTSAVLAMQYNAYEQYWESEIDTVYRTSGKNTLHHLDFSVLKYYSNSANHSYGLAVWEENENGTSKIRCSLKKDTDTLWPAPELVTIDSVSNTDPRVTAVSDSTMILVWKKGKVLLYSLVTPSGKTEPDTVGCAASGTFDFDLSNRYSEGSIVWTYADTLTDNTIHLRSYTTYPVFSFSEERIITFTDSVFNPRIVQGYYGPDCFLYERSINGRHEIMLYSGYFGNPYPDENVSMDSLADDRNPVSFVSPVVTKMDPSMAHNAFPYYNGMLAYEKYTGDDSLLIFRTYDQEDTVKSIGYNKNACLGGSTFFTGGRLNVLTVWESNRTGRSHIYSRLSGVLIDNVAGEGNALQSFSLDQNYPNPFNPTTTIQFTVSKSEFVSLKIYDQLGRTIATIVNERMQPGRYSKTWNAMSISSGVYFYALEAGTFRQVKKLILLK